ncbi:hypothetical protein, partial [Vibrio cholerae]|uniref:hypothetical protein n=1 Tax=Vibrio cholerae TaxID=666 RepID=UPI0019553419
QYTPSLAKTRCTILCLADVIVLLAWLTDLCRTVYSVNGGSLTISRAKKGARFLIYTLPLSL